MSHIFDHESILNFYDKLNIVYKFYKMYLIYISCQKLFPGIKHYTFRYCKECDRKNGMKRHCILSLCVIWGVVLMPIVYTLFHWVKSMEWNRGKILEISRYFVFFQKNILKAGNCWKTASLEHLAQILHVL